MMGTHEYKVLPQTTRPEGKPPYRIGLLTNPDSRRNKKAMAVIENLLPDNGQISHYRASTPDEIADCLDTIAADKPDVLAINGGDGTVQAALTTLFAEQPFATVPLLALIPGGNTNMTARDIGFGGSTTSALKKLIQWAQTAPTWNTVARPIVEVRAHPDATPRYGMFFGIGAITKGIEYCHNRIYKLGLGDEVAPGLAGVRVLLDVIRGKSDMSRAMPIELVVDGNACAEKRDCLLLLVSTLERLFLGMHPYWGQEDAPLHYTWVRSKPDRLLRTIPSLLRGKPNRFATTQAGYASHNVHHLEITIDGPFTLDGELYEAKSEMGPIVVSHTAPLHFLCL